MRKFAWKPILDSLEGRESDIRNAIESAKKAKAEMEELTASNEKLLQEARLEKDNLLKEAQVTAKALVEEAKEQAQKEGAIEKEKAMAAINSEKKAALAEIKNLATELSLEIAEKILKKELSDKSAQEALISDYLNEAELTA